MPLRDKTLLLSGLVAILVLAAPASASQLLARDASDVTLKVNKKGMALVTYRLPSGKKVRLLAWGAINARTPDSTRPQVKFKTDYAGGWGTFRKAVWKTFKNRCQPYDGPPLELLVTACKAPDGSYWALQTWRRALPVFGRIPKTSIQKAWELRLSHWEGELPKMDVYQDWIYRDRMHNVFARLTYKGAPVFGFERTKAGAPLDGYGRNVYFDALDSAYGKGWWRTNGLLTHNPTGVVCAAHAGPDFMPDEWRVNHGKGRRYRATVAGPGATPDLRWEGPALPDWDPTNPAHVAHERAMEALMASFGETDKRCISP